ncbi:hypothetical protein G647_00168 [Cladophialophora carrionii CBS 160.54]|uniref:alpha-L-rhamnosidase n=1 Tax=Cladophialophora carrionii CBS 160.54 TaxID=1279043 RepID=V9DLC0_9EURO|nr:uncharacterized protein G647_00168 [Cladophialophora carrionii CBS 160.54]ETI27719.1 hypothetical protein G647_00168 [Cladophialophora carrionii CBS 160.54]
MHYQVYDVEALLETKGANLITVDVAPGWLASVLAWVDGRRCMFGDELGLLAQLYVSFKDGDAEMFVVGTDCQWQCQCSRITSSEIYNGEVYDMTFESAPVTRGEAQSTSSRTNPQAVKVVSFDFAKLVSPNAPTVRDTEAVRPVSIFESASGKTIIDFGQNLVGWLQIFELRKPAGHVVQFRHAEVMENGELGTVLNGMKSSAGLETSKSLPRLQTSCTTRLACWGTGSTILLAEQMEPWRERVPPFVVPDVITKAHPDDDDFWPHIPNAVWDDAAVLVPWSLYLASGDKEVLEKQYESMTSWIDRGLPRGTNGLWDANIYQLGDGLDPMAPPAEPGNGRTAGAFVADTYLVRVTDVMTQACAVLGRDDDANRYRSDCQRLKQAFHDKYAAKSGLLVADTQTALSLAVVFNLLDSPDQLAVVGDTLARAVRLQQFSVSTGFAGTPIITHALTSTGHPELAYRMVLVKNCPSWMYPISMGVTTIWERWDSMLPDGSIKPGEMTSFNHYALGSVMNSLHECVGGISRLNPDGRESKSSLCRVGA